MRPDFKEDGDKLEIISPPNHVVWKNMEEEVKKGTVKSIGVSNATIPILIDLIAGAEIPPAVNQIEIHPYLQQKDVLKWHQKFNVYLQAYAPVCSGHANAFKKEEVRKYSVFEDDVIASIAQKHGATNA